MSTSTSNPHAAWLTAVRPACTPSEHRVLTAFAAFTNAEGIGSPSIRMIATAAAATPTKVKKTLRTLAGSRRPTWRTLGRPRLIASGDWYALSAPAVRRLQLDVNAAAFEARENGDTRGGSESR